MSALRFLHLDVFAARRGGGNHLGVVLGADDWSAEAMQRFAHWTALVETTFLLAPDVPTADYRVRIFTPHKEIPFAGHPSIGSAHAALATGFATASAHLLHQQCGAGVLPIRVEGTGETQRLLLRAPAAKVLGRGIEAHPLLTPATHGIRLGALPPALVDGGRRWWLVEIDDEAALRAWQPDHVAIAALAQATASMGICAFARSHSGAYQLTVRAFADGAGIAEDPASGAANGLLAAWIAHAEPAGPLARGYRVSQGREIGFDAALVARIEAGAVWIGGRTHTIIDGTLDWPGA
ncbi:MAG: PhzF family phenazine biosynthesis protein [Rhodanobacter sp.]|nr:MAG: PhzF family phenazine biosynthesis protein [Rhodanobacter sp.]TAM14536.1 MAG: PhzF family phenazine biosynthesis protein [Rhodanobacter sp.]TAM37327.1 MAG: PhzF family phenazine biosynthesis protein [Rhodanobacter sp.]